MSTLFDAYEILEPLHDQSFGTLYRARDRATNGLVLVVRPQEDGLGTENLGRLRREASLCSGIQAGGKSVAGVQRVLKTVEDGAGEALVLGYFAGTSLAAFRGQPLPLGEFFPLALALCRSVDDLHRAGFVHLNLSPTAILWDRSAGETLLVDFIRAVPVSHEGGAGPWDTSRSWEYVSPEQTGRLGLRADGRSDYYSLGMVFYTLLTGRPAFTGLGRVETIHAHLAKVPARPPVSAPLADLVLKLLEKVPERRYRSMTGLVADLERCRDDWEARHELVPFDLGAQDDADRFQPSQELFGRRAELEALDQAYSAVRDGGREVVLVCGPSGVGKSSLVREVGSWAVRDQGLFLQGKHDASTRDQPYAAFLQCLDSLVAQILRDRDRGRWKLALELGLSGNLPVVASLVPSICSLVGPQDEPAPLPPKETESRFLFTVTALLRAVLGQRFPVVFFLDDIQWIDPASLRLLEYLAGQEDPSRLFIVLASRQEREEAVTSWLSRPAISLGPLAEADVAALVSASLGSCTRPAGELARVLWERTRGNHFFVTQALRRVYQDGVVTYDRAARAWTWDPRALAALSFSENVYDLLIADFRSLPGASQRALGVAAVIGSTVRVSDLELFTSVTGDLAGALAPLVERHYLVAQTEGFLGFEPSSPLPGDLSFRFQHDRIRQSAWEALEDETRGRYQLILARGLAQALSGGSSDRLGEAAALFLPHLDRISDVRERESLAPLFFRAGDQARSRSARDQALEYFLRARDLCGPTGGDEALRRRIYLRLAEMLYLSGRTDEADLLSSDLQARMSDPLERAEVSIMQIDVLAFLGKDQVAIERGLKALGSLGFRVPPNPGPVALAQQLLPVMARASAVTVDSLMDRKAGVPPRVLTLMRILGSLQVPANLSRNSNFPVLLILKATDLALRHGNNPESAQAFCHFAILLSGLGNPKRAFEFGTLALRLSEAFPDPKTRAHVHNVYSLYCLPWNRPWAEHAPAALRSADLALLSGDLFTLAYEIGFSTQFAFDLPLAVSLERGRRAVKQISDVGQPGALTAQRLTVQRWRCLAGELEGPVGLSDQELDFDQAMAEWKSQGTTTGLAVGYSYLLGLQVLFAETDLALGTFEELERYASAVAGSGYMAEITLFTFLLMADLAPRRDWRGKAKARMAKERARMAVWAASCPANFAHWALLMGAEILASAGRVFDAAKAFEEALVLVDGASSPRDKALVHERAGAFHLGHGHVKVGSYLMREAHQWYETWGAHRKAEHIRRVYPDLALGRRSVSGNGADPGDLSSVLKVTQALSRETDLDRLLAAVVHTVVESAGAQRGWLLLESQEKPGTWEVCARSDSTGSSDAIASTPSAEGLSDLVIRTALGQKEGVVLGDASVDPVFSLDPDLRSRSALSVLCLPFGLPGESPVGLWYLENNLMPGAFPPGRREVLATLSGQVAASITNARTFRSLAALNRTLEQKVEERTAELEEQNRQFLASVEYAAVLQRSLLPQSFGALVTRHFEIFSPRDPVGGDLYWFHEGPKGCLLALVDCTGHGVPGALISVMVHSLLEEISKDADPSDLALVVRHLNQRFRRILGQDRPGAASDDGFDIGLLWWAPGQPVLRFAGAHIGLFVRDPSGVRYLPGVRQSLGYPRTPEDLELPVLELPLVSGLEVVLSTDGTLGQTGGPKGVSWGRERFAELLGEVADLPGADQEKRILEAFHAYRGAQPQQDDVTVLGLRFGPVGD
jgi:predicted ATPase/serine phosphatase RsbU (regulator of sigma subunit)